MIEMKAKNIVLGIILLVFLSGGISIQAQDNYFTRDAYISFFSSTPLEDIKAVNENVTCIIDATSGKIEVAALMKAFQFKKALMEEHFNENYVESEKFPKATFIGQINNINDMNLKQDGVYPANVDGTLTIHGESKQIASTGNIEVKNGKIILNSEFKISPEDYRIDIPGVVRDKIAKDLLITFKAELAPFNR